jgi:hypothetical protein
MANPFSLIVAGVDNTTVSGAGRTGTLAAIDFSVAHDFSVGQSIKVSLLTGPSGFAALNGVWTIASTTSTRVRFDTDTSGAITLAAATGTVSINLIGLPGIATTAPYVDLGSLSMTLSGDGNGGSMTFDVIEAKTPAAGAWWRSGAVHDNARVQFFDSRYSATTPIFLGYITGIDARMLENGLGSRASVTCEDADGWLQKTIIRNGKTGIRATSFVDSFTQGGASSTDRDHINALLARVNTQVNDATTRQILDTSVVSGSTRAIYTGTAQTIGKQSFKATTLQSALDQIAEAAGGIAEVQYRYWIDNDGRLNYGPKVAAPTYATAPAEIVTDPAEAQTGSAAARTILLARDLSVNLDHGDIVKGIFVQADSAYARYDNNQTWPNAPTNDPYFRTYNGTYSRNGAGLAARSGPLAHEVFSAPKIVAKADRGATIGALARATMVTRGKPVRTVSFTIAGANLSQTSAPDWEYGYSQGYALTAPATYTLVKAWLPGMYVKLTAPSLDLSSTILYIASVTMRFAEGGGTYQVQYDIQADFRRQYLKGLRGLIQGE